MKLTTRRTARAAIAMVAAAGLAISASAPTQAADKKRLVFSPIALAIPALQGLAEGVKGWGAGNGWDVQIVDGNFDPTTQANGLKTVISSGAADAIWVLAVQPAALKEVAQLAQEKGVAMLLNGTPEDYGYSSSNFPKGLSFGLIDYTAEGTALGKQAARCIKEKKIANPQVIYAPSAAGTAGKETVDKLTLKFLKAGAPKAKVVAQVIAESRAKVQTDARAILARNPKANVIIATNDEGTLGLMGAFKLSRKTATCVIGFGGNDEVLAAVKAGKVYAAVALNFDADFGQTVAELGRLVADPKATGKQLKVPQNIVKK